MLEINFCKAVVTNDWPAVLFAKLLVFTSDGIETGRKTTLASFHRVHLAKHRKLHAETGRCIAARRMVILSHFPNRYQASQRVADDESMSALGGKGDIPFGPRNVRK